MLCDTRRSAAWDAVWSVAVTGVVLGPVLLHRGFVLVGDMVFVPDQPWKAAWLGLDGSVPRSVPMDAVVWALGLAAPGDLVQKLLLVTILVGGGIGAGQLLRCVAAPRPVPRLASGAAVTFFLWNPWVLERLAIGQWAAVAGYAVLPWLVRAAVRLRRGHPGAWGPVATLLVLSGVCAPSVGLIGVLTALLVVAGRHTARAMSTVLASGLVANLPWLLPALLREEPLRGASAPFGAFAARAESSLGTLPSLLTLGGIWKSSVVPPERTVPLVVLLTLLLTGAALCGLLWSPGDREVRRKLLVLGVVAVQLAWLPAVAPIGDLLDAVAQGMPALGILRDSQRSLAPAGLVLSTGLGLFVERVQTGPARRWSALGAAGALGVALPVLLLPSMAWGLAGQLDPVRYPQDWTAVAQRLARTGQGSTVVLPWHGSYRGFAWNDHRAGLDPAPRFLPGDVLIDDRVFLEDRVLGHEEERLAAVGRALQAPDPVAALRAEGVGQVLLEIGQGAAGEVRLPGAVVVHDGPQLRLLDLGEPADVRDPSPPAGFVAVGDAAVIILLLGGLIQNSALRRTDG